MRKILLILLVIVGVFFVSKDKVQRQYFKSPVNTTNNTQQRVEEKDVEVIAQDLDIPWEVVFLPTGEMLLTERPGNLVLIGKDRQKVAVEGVVHKGEGGLMGLALHPNFSQNSWIYLYLTSSGQGPTLSNRVERYKLNGTTLSERKVVLENIPGAPYHDGGRIAFGPDNYLYIATGDAGQEDLAQDTSSLAGKVLRVTDEGEIPSDNPFGNPVYSYGHRNVQGLAWDKEGGLWATEHGPSGIGSGWDEINRIQKGGNFGWPQRADEQKEGTEKAVKHSGKDVWAPSGMLIDNDTIYFAGLRGEAIYSYKINDPTLVVREVIRHLGGQFGRLRTIVKGTDGSFYILTNNTDGRGSRKDGDDKLLKINPEVF